MFLVLYQPEPSRPDFKFWIQARIAQLEAYWLGTKEVLGSNPGKGENFSVKISNWIVQIWIQLYFCKDNTYFTKIINF